jgi:predicted acylesterase/phospholipase RssA
MVQYVNMNAIGVQPADVVIEPDVLDFELTEFARSDELAAAGARATEEALPKIKRLLLELNETLFSTSPTVAPR